MSIRLQVSLPLGRGKEVVACTPNMTLGDVLAEVGAVLGAAGAAGSLFCLFLASL